MIKRNLFRLMAIMMVTTLCMGFTACGDDDDDDVKNPIVATWTNLSNENQEYQFKSNGDVVNHIVNPKYKLKGVTDQELNDSEVEKYVYGTYTVNGNSFTIIWTNEKTLVVKSDNSREWVKNTYSPAKIDEGTFTVTRDIDTYFLTLNTDEGGGISSTWQGWSE